MTVSGGEPLLQAAFVRALFSECGKAGIHRVVDTSGFCRHGKFQDVLGVTDRMLFSLKVIDQQKHITLTTVSNEKILVNLRLASESPVELVVRYVLIPASTTAKDIEDLIAVLKSLNRQVLVDVLPYHRMGIIKWEQLGLEYALRDVPEPAEEDLQQVREKLTRAELEVVRYS